MTCGFCPRHLWVGNTPAATRIRPLQNHSTSAGRLRPLLSYLNQVRNASFTFDMVASYHILATIHVSSEGCHEKWPRVSHWAVWLPAASQLPICWSGGSDGSLQIFDTTESCTKHAGAGTPMYKFGTPRGRMRPRRRHALASEHRDERALVSINRAASSTAIHGAFISRMTRNWG